MNTDDDGHLKLEKTAQLFYSKAPMDIGDRPLTQIQKYMFNLGENAYRLKKNEAIPLPGFLLSVAREAWLSGAVDEQPVNEVAVAVAYQAILQVAKSSIRNQELEVLEMVSLAPMNDNDRVRSWCLSTCSEVWDDPIAGLVVRHEEAGRWLQDTQLPVPELLRDIFSAAADEGDVPPSPGQPVKKNAIGQRVRDRNKELKAAGHPSVIKALAAEFCRDPSTIKKHLYGKKKEAGASQRKPPR